MKRKLIDKSGESIIESLIAIPICALSVGMLVMMVTTSTKLIKKSEDGMAQYKSGLNGVISGDDAAKADGGNVTIAMDGTSFEVPVDYYQCDGIGGTSIVAFTESEESGT